MEQLKEKVVLKCVLMVSGDKSVLLALENQLHMLLASNLATQMQMVYNIVMLAH